MGHLDLHGELTLRPPLKSDGFLIFQSQELNLESPKFNSFTPRHHGGGLNLYTGIGDIALRITVNKAQRKVHLNSRTAGQNDGWGIDETAQLPLNAWGGPISICVYDQGDRYHLMVGLVTVHSFLKRIKTPYGIVKVGYSLPDPGPQWDPTLSRRLAVSVWKLSDLSDRVRKAIEGGNLTEQSISGCGTDYSEPEVLVVEPKSQSAGASVIDSLPGCIGYVNHPLTMVSWENGKEIRMYYLDSKRILQEYAYSERKKKKCWYSGDLSRLKIVLSPDSVIAAVQLSDEIRIYYQEIGSGVIREVRKPPQTDSWIKDTTLSVAVKSSKIAVIGWINDGTQIRVYYQDPHFRLEEYCYANGRWTRGAFDPGPQPPGTPIVAEVSYIGYPAIQVLWKNSSGRFVSSCCDKYSQWDHPPVPEHGDPDEPNPSQLDGSG